MSELRKSPIVALVVSLVAIVAAQGCGSGKQTAPPSNSSAGSSSTTAGNGGSATSNNGGSGTAEGGAAGANEETGGTGGVHHTGGSGGGDACTSPTTGCYKCAPKTTEQFLNACGDGDGTCSLGYDNSLIPALLNNNGKLPPLP